MDAERRATSPRITGGTRRRATADARATSFAFDSRAARAGRVLRRARRATRDGHDFVADAFRRGCHRRARRARAHGCRARVDGARSCWSTDPLAALGALGAAARPARAGRRVVVGITGSAGKTGTKDLTQAALGGPPAVHASPGSYNNEVGRARSPCSRRPPTRPRSCSRWARAARATSRRCARSPGPRSA